MSIAIAGVGAVPVQRKLDRPLADTCAQVIAAAIEDGQLEPADIDGLFVTPSAMSGEMGMMWAANLAEFLGFPTRQLMMCENGGMTATVTLRAAMDAVALGRCKAAVVLASDTRPNMDMSQFESFMRRVVYNSLSLHGPNNGVMGLGAPVPIYAMSHQRYMHEYGVTEEQIAHMSVILRQHSAHHPWAQFRKEVTVDEVLSSQVISPPIHLLQAAGISAGAVALIITPGDTVRGQGRPVVNMTGWGEYHDPSHFVPQRGSITTFKSVKEAAAQAFVEAGKSPKDVDIAEVYGVFGATECILYEDLGFCEKGKASMWAAEGHTTFGGDVVINPTGGRISLGHPAGATPLYEVAEVVMQLRGDAVGKQVENARVGLIHAEHGMMNGSSVAIFEREA